MGLQLPATFASSYGDYISYPENLSHKSTYAGGLRSYKLQLDAVQSKLFSTKDVNINVPFRDLQQSGNGILSKDISKT